MDSTTTRPPGVSGSAAPRIGWFRVLTPELQAGFVGMLVILIAMLVIGLINLRNVYTTSAAREHTYAVKIALQQLLSSTLDAETGERGFTITGLASYLDPYEPAPTRLSGNLAPLRALTASHPDTQAHCDQTT